MSIYRGNAYNYLPLPLRLMQLLIFIIFYSALLYNMLLSLGCHLKFKHIMIMLKFPPTDWFISFSLKTHASMHVIFSSFEMIDKHIS